MPALAAVVMLAIAVWRWGPRRRRPVYLLDFDCWRCDPKLRVSLKRFMQGSIACEVWPLLSLHLLIARCAGAMHLKLRIAWQGAVVDSTTQGMATMLESCGGWSLSFQEHTNQCMLMIFKVWTCPAPHMLACPAPHMFMLLFLETLQRFSQECMDFQDASVSAT